MSAPALSSERIRDLYRTFQAEDPYPAWRANYRETLQRVQQIDGQTLATPAVQEDLWTLRDMATLGSGDSVNVQGAYTDAAIVAAIVELRALAREPDADLIVHFEGLTQFHCPRLAPWGPSIYVNRVTGPIIDVGTRRRLQIEMQSGDVLEIEYQSHCIDESTPHSAADPTNDPTNEQDE